MLMETAHKTAAGVDPPCVKERGGRMLMGTVKTRRRWVKPETTPVRLGAEVTAYAGVDPARP